MHNNEGTLCIDSFHEVKVDSFTLSCLGSTGVIFLV